MRLLAMIKTLCIGAVCVQWIAASKLIPMPRRATPGSASRQTPMVFVVVVRGSCGARALSPALGGSVTQQSPVTHNVVSQYHSRGRL